MTWNDGFRPLPRKSEDSAKSRVAPFARGLNHPVPLAEFDRERMGVAAKE